MKNLLFYLTLLSGFLPLVALAQTPPALRVVVNSNQDGPVNSDGGLTLREAIALVNGGLSLNQLSDAEKAQVTPLATGGSLIEFNLPSGQTAIRLTSVLPDLAVAGLTIDGTSQPGYTGRPVINELATPAPVVEITPAAGAEVFRGLTVVADGVTIRGLSLYGFASQHRVTASTPPADIFIAHRLPPPDVNKQQPPANFFPYYSDDRPPQNVVIEGNWLGIRPDQSMPEATSAFGVSVFNGVGTVIRRNWIAYHDGSAVITSVRAEGTQVSENVITGNGIAGMPDAIRLEGLVNQTQIRGNLLCGNDGAAIYLFKPEGAVQIRDNRLSFNGRRLRRAAVYLMGNGHQVIDNQISDQTGPGVVVAAYPRSVGNQIADNRFSRLEGLSIDLVTQDNVDVSDYQRGDGPNPPRNSPNRRRDTGNGAINSPVFQNRSLTATDNQVQIQGMADPGSQIEFYRAARDNAYGPLTEPLATVTADSQGQFAGQLAGLQPGDRISAIATLPPYGTSEPAVAATVTGSDGSAPEPNTPVPAVPSCVSQVEPTPPPTPPTPPPTPIRLQIPARIHFALDRANISPATARVLDRIVQVLEQNPTILVEMVGHTDPRASDAYNLALGARRAMSARNYLLRRGIAPERLTIRSQGERQPVSRGTTRLDYARDRRVEFRYRDARAIEVIVQEEDLQLEP